MFLFLCILTDFYANLPLAATDYLKCPFNLKSPAGSNSILDCVRDKPQNGSRRRLSATDHLTRGSSGAFTFGKMLTGAVATLLIVFLLCAMFSVFNTSKGAYFLPFPKKAAIETATGRLPLTNPREMDGFYGDAAFDGGATPVATPVL